MSNVVYFAYGSNMSRRRIEARVPSARFMSACELKGHKLTFDKSGEKDGSGKCNIVAAPDSVVHGALFELPSEGILVMDSFEGRGYDRKVILVENHINEVVEAYVYVANITDPEIRPYRWYVNHVLQGAKELNLPAAYIRYIQSVDAIEDNDQERAAVELGIYH